MIEQAQTTMHITVEGVARNKPYFMAIMFNPAIVWDTSRLAIAHKMTSLELTAIAKRSTRILRDSTPEITEVLTTYDTVRSKLAQTTILQKLDDAGLLTTAESRQREKSRARAEKSLEHIDTVTEKYRSQAGYRVACLSLLLENESKRNSVLSAFEDLDLLCTMQQTLFQALLLEDLLHWSNCYAQRYPDYEVDSANADYVKKLQSRIRTLGEGLEKIQALQNGSPVSHYLDNSRLRNPVLNGTDRKNPIITVTAEFALLKECFTNLNENLSTLIAIRMDDTVQEAADWDLNLVRAA